MDPDSPLTVKQQRACDLYLTPGTPFFSDQTAAYREAGYWVGKASGTARNQASLFFKKPKIARYCERVRAAATERSIRGAQDVIAELWHDADQLKPLVVANGKAHAGVASARTRIMELLGRHYRTWSPEDAADATADHIPLAERLKAYQREQAIDAAPNVERLRPAAER